MKKTREKRPVNNLPASGDQMEDREESILGELFRDDILRLNSSRRNFLKVFGFSFASAAVLAACKRPVREAIPYAVQPPELIPRKPLYYASTFYDGHEFCGILVKTLDGRPIKIEGNALCEFNREGTTARVQASVLSLYDDSRLKYPMIDGRRVSWATIDEQLIKDLSTVRNSGRQVVLLTSSVISPTTKGLIENFGKTAGSFKWVKYDPVSYSALLEANSISFGKQVIPDYHFQNAGVVVSFNADFLGTWVAPVHFIPKYVSQRKLNDGRSDMLYHVQVESGLSLTGSNADRRIKIRPSEEKAMLTDLYNKIAAGSGAQTFEAPAFREDISNLAQRLLDSKGKSIVISGTNNTGIQVIVNAINSLLGNYGSCIDLDNPINIASGIDKDITELLNDLSEGRTGALLMYNVNPAYDLPEPQKFLDSLSKVPVTVNMSVALNETSGKAKYECPVNHYLESWDDAEILPGQLSLGQPCISPIFDTRSFQDSLLKWSGSQADWHNYLMMVWEREYFPGSGILAFRDFWNKSLSDGVFTHKVAGVTPVSFRQEALENAIRGSSQKSEGFEIILNECVAMGTGMHSNNPWLMELPDPVTKHCWENVAAISLKDAGRLGVVTGQVIRIGSISIPVVVQPGQAESTISVSLGYGHTASGPVAEGNGINVFPLAKISDGNRSYSFVSDIAATDEKSELALVQMHNLMEGRPIVRETVLSAYRQKPGSGNELHEEFEKMHKSLYPDSHYDGFHWAMAIDLNACIGCNACVIACQAENNSPTVGKSEVKLNRIMHWIKVHRYYSEETDNPRVYFQPVFCQHCDDAPCENVCPVSATNHNNEGLNQVTYNRCVGTKYCMNNCPYRVRRFNWFRYTGNKEFDYNSASGLGKMVLNPDVTVRERGVVEKCTFCVQRIQAKKLEAKLENRVLQDLEIKPACMQACPAGAIIFGNLNDRNSRVAQLFASPRRYHLLEELHTLPAVGFLTKVRNDEGEGKA